ncbi:MAG: BlaI/MecI/CopY family transcriptional regulator [Pirellulales bacterium]|nr:BlaI/MecI/CopY family transcriptional regulator [Pirellulales bacterium]
MNERLPTDRELEALKILWHRGRATVREIWSELGQAEGELAYTSVLSLMQAMEQKGLVGHEEVGRAYAYFAKVEHDSTFQKLAGGFLDKVFDGAMDQYLVHGLRSCRPSLEELDELERMIAEAKKQSRQKPKRGKRS